jgi:hypothetical protein
MNPKPMSFVIPTYRLRDVGDTVAQYDEHFWRNGHAAGRTHNNPLRYQELWI